MTSDTADREGGASLAAQRVQITQALCLSAEGAGWAAVPQTIRPGSTGESAGST